MVNCVECKKDIEELDLYCRYCGTGQHKYFDDQRKLGEAIEAAKRDFELELAKLAPRLIQAIIIILAFVASFSLGFWIEGSLWKS